jgi:hypothetical protein
LQKLSVIKIAQFDQPSEIQLLMKAADKNVGKFSAVLTYETPMFLHDLCSTFLFNKLTQ